MALEGSTPWAIILCKYSDKKKIEPRPQKFFRDFYIEPGTGGMFDYRRDVSYGKVDLKGSEVFGWLDLPFSLSDAMNNQPNRATRILAVVDAFKSKIDFSRFYGIIVVPNVQIESGSIGIVSGPGSKSYGMLILDPGVFGSVTFTAHEMGHSYGLDHSFNTNSVSNDPANGGRPGEYGDPWDIMSAMLVRTFAGTFGSSGPGLNAINHLRLGWLPDRIFRADMTFGFQNLQVVLSALNQNDTSADAIAIIETQSGQWTTEYRRPIGWDAGIEGDMVLVHQSRSGLSTVLPTEAGDPILQPRGRAFVGPGFSVNVMSFDPARGQAIVGILTQRTPPPPRGRPCEIMRSSILGELRVLRTLSRQLKIATSQEQIEQLTRQIEEEIVQLDALYDDFNSAGCEDPPPRRWFL